MGKARKKKTARRHNPIRVPDSHIPHGLAAAASTSTKKDSIPPVFHQIASANATDRAFGCASVSNLIHNDPSTRRLLQGKGIIDVLIEKLSDPVEEVVVEASGALRNLGIDGGHEICAQMYNRNILASMTPYIPKISSAISTFLTAPPTSMHRNLVFQLAENLITLFWCLSETSNKALNAINNVGLMPFLMAFLEHRAQLPLALVNAAAQCIYVLSDDNASTIEALRTGKSSFVPSLLSVVQSDFVTPVTTVKSSSETEAIMLRVLVCGILKNISPIPPKATGGETLNLDKDIILPILTPLLNVSLGDASSVVEAISSHSKSKIPTHLQNTPGSDHKSPDEHELERIEAQLRTVQLALEILSGICASLPDFEDDPGDEAEFDIEDSGAGAQGNEDEDALHAGTPITLLSLSTPLLALIAPTPLSFPPPSLPSLHPPTTSVLSAIHIVALECLNNLFVKVQGQGEESVKKGAEGVWNAVWGSLGDVNGPGRPGLTFGNPAVLGTEKRGEAWLVAVGALWGLARVCRGTLVPNAEQVQILMELCDIVTEEKAKVQCIGTLGCIAQNPGSIEANKVVSQYLINIVRTGERPEPTLQAVSEIIDIYSDEASAYDVNFRQGNYLEILSERSGAVKKLVKSLNVKRPGGRKLRGWGEGVAINMRDFVRYRKNLRL
ncbi:ARM repeat-containing protein [Cantharellus anzutake]|uniref:ARM repeat-containing protein n=1 Tax=Cantharellus anzutake TaxID=1750568 RepID=UPI0019050BE7|nr:ARM repeat-containing protein [Cantharellus anzutake]KAF8336322.1 ARM repeat-containing protein [Cantharellus anzutake]